MTSDTYPIDSADGFSIHKIQELINYIEENLLTNISLSQIASHFYLSTSNINSFFKMATGLTVMEYIRNRRLSLAGQDLLTTNLHIIDLAYKYGYETPEAFTKAFSRLYGFPPYYVRRTYPKLKRFLSLQITVHIQGGWNDEQIDKLTKTDNSEQDSLSLTPYNELIKLKGGQIMDHMKNYQLKLEDMKQQNNWNTLLHLVHHLKEAGVTFKVDGNTMIFAHGIEFELEKICITLKLDELEKTQKFFNTKAELKQPYQGFQYFDTSYEGMKIRCMYYSDSTSADDTLFRNTDMICIGDEEFHAQSLEFYYENSTPESFYYDVVEEYLRKEKH